ncbi:MAG: hypothetical protein IH876_14455, partial [Gemmatimonadetes bacterium]|nr:hypothetical protein [Gemmatimonadota bacterium]
MRIERLALVAAAILVACGGGDDGLPEQIVLTPEPGSYDDPEYSPDGMHLAFTRRQ